MCVFKCIHVCLCATYMPVPVCQKSEVDALDLDYQLLSATLWVLGTEVGASGGEQPVLSTFMQSLQLSTIHSGKTPICKTLLRAKPSLGVLTYRGSS